MKKIEFYQNKNVIHNQLRTVRKLRSLSQKELAAKMQVMNVNIDQQMISKIEKNTRIVTDYEFACFCSVLEVSADELLRDFNEKFVKPL